MEYFRVISIHALREEGDSRATSRAPQSRNFYPRPPRGGRPAGCSGGEKETASISIHALREEGDNSVYVHVFLFIYFYPRPPRGGRHWATCPQAGQFKFLSTPSARRATSLAPILTDTFEISIHALREEGDTARTSNSPQQTHFYPRPPRGGRPQGAEEGSWPLFISIHALREEGDGTVSSRATSPSNFYPRPPRGGRQAIVAEAIKSIKISIHALREEGDQRRRARRNGVGAISIHALREEGDTDVYALIQSRLDISIHALREEGDACSGSTGRSLWVFLSTPSARRATCSASVDDRRRTDFYPRPPRGGRPTQRTTRHSAIRFLSTPSARRATYSIPGLIDHH